MGSIDLLIILFAVIAIYGIWRYSKAEENDYSSLRKEVLDLSSEIKQTKIKSEDTQKLTELQRDQLAITKQNLDSISQEMDQVQEHMQRLRAQQARLKEKMIPEKKIIKVQHVGAIPFEIYKPTTPLPAQEPSPKNDLPRNQQLKRLKKQIDQFTR